MLSLVPGYIDVAHYALCEAFDHIFKGDADELPRGVNFHSKGPFIFAGGVSGH